VGTTAFESPLIRQRAFLHLTTINGIRAPFK